MDLDPLTLIVDLLCVYRITRLIVRDSLLNTPRWWILRRWPSELTTFPGSIVVNSVSTKEMTIGELAGTGLPLYLSDEVGSDGLNVWMAQKTHKITELIECGFCASVWLSFAVMAFNPWHGWITYVLTSLALAGGVALIFTLWDNE